MFVSFRRGSTCLKGVRFGYRLKGATAAFAFFGLVMFYSVKWIVLGTGAMIYGVCWLTWAFCKWTIYKPAAWLIGRIKGRKKLKKSEKSA